MTPCICIFFNFLAQVFLTEYFFLLRIDEKEILLLSKKEWNFFLILYYRAKMIAMNYLHLQGIAKELWPRQTEVK